MRDCRSIGRKYLTTTNPPETEMNPPSGWRNLSTTRHRIRDIRELLPLIQTTYPTAVERPVKDGVLAYWVDADPGLIGIAWQDEVPPSWSYVVMSRTAFDLGIGCSIVPITDDRVRIIPGKAGASHTIDRQVEAAKARSERQRRRFPAFIHPEAGEWFVTIETPNGDHRFGPFESSDVAHRMIPELMEQVVESISKA